jgi:hypothetical protein
MSDSLASDRGARIEEYSTVANDNIIKTLTDNYTKIVSVEDLAANNIAFRENRRWYKKRYNYSAVYSNNTHGETANPSIPAGILDAFLQTRQGAPENCIIGIYIHSKRQYRRKHNINSDIVEKIKSSTCVVCSRPDTVIDYKNDLLYNERVLCIDDFQPLCRLCSLRKRNACMQEKKTQKIYSAKNIPLFENFPFEFPWEKTAFDASDPNCKKDTYWYDPCEFMHKIHLYMRYTLPLITAIKLRSSK